MLNRTLRRQRDIVASRRSLVDARREEPASGPPCRQDGRTPGRIIPEANARDQSPRGVAQQRTGTSRDKQGRDAAVHLPVYASGRSSGSSFALGTLRVDL